MQNIMLGTLDERRNKYVGQRLGVTLVEVLVGLVVLAISFGAVFALSSNVMRIMKAARNESRATQAAQYELEKLMTYSWSEVLALGESYSISTNDNLLLSDISSGAGTVTITPSPATNPNAPVRAICVAVSWKTSSGLTQTNVITTLIAEGGFLR